MDNVGLALFNIVFGNQVYALAVTYQPTAVYYQNEIVSVSFHWIFTLQKTKVPIETILRGCRAETMGSSSFSFDNKMFILTLNMLVWVSNRVKLFTRTFTFEDVEPRQVTVYLHNYKLEYGLVHVEITGSYKIDGVEAPISVGEVLET